MTNVLGLAETSGSSLAQIKPSSVTESAKTNYHAIDGLRALSMCLIVVYHCFLVSGLLIGTEQFEFMIRNMPVYLNWIWHTDKSVDIFFVISGFLISSMLFKEYKASSTIRLGNFFWRRFLRLMPMYWLALLLFYPFLANQHNIWANFLYVNNFLPADEMFMGWSWTLAVEEQFYFLLPFLILYVFPRFRSTAAVLVGLIILSTLILFLFHLAYPEFNNYHPSQFMFGNLEGFTYRYFEVIYDNLYTRFGALACGCLVGYLHVYHAQEIVTYLEANKNKLWIYLFLAVFVIVAQTTIPHFNPDVHFSTWQMILYSTLHRNIFSIAISVIIVLSLYPVGSDNLVSRFLSLPIWGFIAKLTYSMYLFHLAVVMLVTNQMHKVAGDLSSAPLEIIFLVIWGNIFIVLAITIAMACITYYGFERPIMNLRKPAAFHA